ncbi:NAD(P)/FAD-dependent oxidoreductase [Alloalcanivorax sp. C16-1]|uniref:NAD(P)/FAD-dependent oxidoreductase n=1 Tax=Alloalcanivorax sp. C16-1 TaxID=3390051 RepID=UPI0039705304
MNDEITVSGNPRRRRLLIVGNGLATDSLIDHLGTDHDWSVQVLGDEPVRHYNRIMLSPLLGGEIDLPSISPRDESWYRARRVTVSPGKRVTGIDRRRRRVLCDDGERIDYHTLVLATGARSSLPPLPGVGALAGVGGFRSLEDVRRLRQHCQARPGTRAVVIGAGLLGVEAAVGLRRLGADVTLVHRRPVLMNRQLDASASSLLEASLAARGIRVRTGCDPRRLLGDGSVSAVEVEEGGAAETLPADLVVFATGITPNRELAQAAGLECGAGVRVDSALRTSEPHVHALGECCEFQGNTYGLVAPVRAQANVLARVLRGQHARYCDPSPVTRLKVSGLDIHSMGQVEAETGQQSLWLSDAAAGVYKKLIIEDGRLRGVLLVGDVRHGQWYAEALQSDRDVSALRDILLTNPTRDDSAATGVSVDVA